MLYINRDIGFELGHSIWPLRLGRCVTSPVRSSSAVFNQSISSRERAKRYGARLGSHWVVNQINARPPRLYRSLPIVTGSPWRVQCSSIHSGIDGESLELLGIRHNRSLKLLADCINYP